MIIQEQMETNLAHFFLVLKSSDCVQYQDTKGTKFEGQISLIHPKEQMLVFNNTKNLATNEIIQKKQISFKDLTYLKVQHSQNQIVTKSKSEKKTKTFVKWDQNVDASNLEDCPIKNFDQFEAIKKFGIEPTFDENNYTTVLTTPVTEDLRKYAEKCEKELKKCETNNKHLLEERNLKQLEDEEEAYSAVVREQPKQTQNEKISKQTQSPKFYNSNKRKEIANKVAFIEKIYQIEEEVIDEPQQQIKIKPVNEDGTTKFKLQQTTTFDIPKLMLQNFINATEGYKWQNMQPDPSKNKKEKLKK